MASPMEAFNSTQTSFPEAIHATISSSQSGILSKALDGTSYFGIFVALFAVAVAYDQGMLCSFCEDGSDSDKLEQSRTGGRKPTLPATR